MSAQNAEFRFGVIGKMEFNRLKIENADNISEVRYQPGAQGAVGLYAAYNIGKRWFIDASGLFSNADYTVNFVRSGAEFINAEIHFAQINLNLNLVLNPNSEKVNVFVFGGGQFLYRRWGEEWFNNAVVPDTYWPTARIMAQAGLGAKCNIGNGFYLQPFVGMRYALEQQLVYDVSLNQVFTGIAVCYGVKGKPKNRYNKCPVEF